MEKPEASRRNAKKKVEAPPHCHAPSPSPAPTWSFSFQSLYLYLSRPAPFPSSTYDPFRTHLTTSFAHLSTTALKQSLSLSPPSSSCLKSVSRRISSKLYDINPPIFFPPNPLPLLSPFRSSISVLHYLHLDDKRAE